jgi:hypothetical protein
LNQRKTILYIGALFILPILLAVFVFIQFDITTFASMAGNRGSINAQQSATQVSSSITPVAPTATAFIPPANAAKTSQAKGVAAIKVLNANTTTNNKASEAQFGEAEVRQFLKDHPEWGQFKSNAPFTIEKVEFITANEVKARIHQDVAAILGVPNNTLFCLMTGHSSFSMAAGPPLSGQAQTSNKGVTFQRAYQLYDAKLATSY